MSNPTPATVGTSAAGHTTAEHTTAERTTAEHGTAGAHARTNTGTNTIADGVVEKVAGLAARQVPGVHDLGKGAARAIGAIRSAINREDRGQGISVEVGERQVAADVVIVAEYPVALQDLADRVRRSVSDAISSIVGMEVTEVTVTIVDVHIPSDDDDEDDDRRVQ